MNSAELAAPAQINDESAFLAELRIYHEIRAFLYKEARLLDEERFQDWLGLLAPEIHYWMPLRENRYRQDRRPEPTPANSASVYNDDYEDLVLRVKRFNTGLVWCEDPAPRLNRAVTNIELIGTDLQGLVTVYSNVSVMRSRRQDEEVTFSAKRRDRFRKIEGQWRLSKRHILATHHVFLDENVSLFF